MLDLKGDALLRWLADPSSRSFQQEDYERGREQAIREVLGRHFTRRVGRRPTPTEENLLVARAHALGPGETQDAILDLEGDALLRWLAEPTAR
jgi:hypothetical protein